MKLFRTRSRKPSVPAHVLRRRLEVLEDRAVPAALSVADITVREGPATLGAIDPAGAATLGLNKPRIIAFDNIPGSAHYHDLFVTSHSDLEGSGGQVLRYDGASQTYQSFVSNGSGGLQSTGGLAFGPDGNLYVSDPSSQSSILEFDGATGNFISVYVSPGAGGLNHPYGLQFASDGNLYVCSSGSNQILKYEGPGSPDGVPAGQFLGVFANTQHTFPFNFAFGPDGNLYLSCPQEGGYTAPTDSFIDRYYGVSSPLAGQFIDTFVASGTGGLKNSRTPLFDQLGHLYVADQYLNEVLEFQGPNGPNPGAYIEAYVTSGQGNLDQPNGLATGPEGNLYISSKLTNQVLRFAPSSQASFVVTLNSASTSQVSVNYATANGTAVAGTDYTQTSGTLIFPAGVTSATVNVPVTTVPTGGPTRTFTLNLSSSVNATIADGQGVGSILNRMTKFFVVDSGTPKTYEYGSGGTSEEISPQNSANTAPRGAATTAAGTTVWVADANKTVYVYSNHGVLLGSWSAGGLPSNAQVEGIATNGTDVWLLDNKQDKVFKYTGAASRLSGSQSAASGFNLNSADSNPKGIVTDGASLWVVDDGSSTDKVFKYTVRGSLLGSWTIDAANKHPTGVTINPVNVSDIWIVDNATLKVYQYAAAASRTSGSQSATAKFALAAGNTNPQDIADPPAITIANAPAIEGGAAYRFTDAFVAPNAYGLAAARTLQLGLDGNIYVASHDTDVIKVFEGGTGQFLRDLSTPGGELDGPWGSVFGPDGRLYVGGRYSHNIVRFDVGTGAFDVFVPGDSGGLGSPRGLAFGPDGNLYASSNVEPNAFTTDTVKEFNGTTGAYERDLVTAGSGGLNNANGLTFGPDGYMYVGSNLSHEVKRYNGQTGAYMGNFVSAGSGGIAGATQLLFRGDGYLYVGDNNSSGNVYRYNAATGAFVDVFARIPTGTDATGASGFAFAPSGEFYVSEGGATGLPGSYVARFAQTSFAAFTVSLSQASLNAVTVNFATADGTALAGSDYTATSGTITFTLGERTRTILVRTLDDALSEPTEMFTVNLSNPVGATISDSQAVGIITDNEPPQISGVTVNNGAAQRSRVTTIDVPFRTQVAFAGPVASAFTLTPNGGGAVTFTATANVVGGITVVTLNNFTGPETQSGSLRDGLYTLTALQDQISAGGLALDGDGNGTGGDNYTFGDAQGLFRFYGDMNGDRRVDISDFGFFSLAFFNPPNYNAALDFNGDGRIDIADFGQFSVRFFTMLP